MRRPAQLPEIEAKCYGAKTSHRRTGQPQPAVHDRRRVRTCGDPGVPAARGLYDPALEKDSCGVGFIADIKGRKSHQIVEDALTILLNLEHRGAVGADPRAGDGAGILVQIPHKLLLPKAAELGFRAAGAGRIRGRRAVHAARGGLAAQRSASLSRRRSRAKA